MKQSVTTSGNIYTQSIYIKPNGHNYFQFNCAGSISSGYVNFDLSNGTIGTTSLWTGRIETLANGWYRLIATTNTVYTSTEFISFFAVDSPTAVRGASVAGTGTSGFYIWGAQFEL